ncbi:hypothetical protein ICN41_08870 [Polynucleobacter sp. 15G-AUS-farblos]|uniref:glycosyltransferase n=1 Tax=Polynucleobacter sp. 15G-AUS-farblos TaxID=2689094 RepID=UPI001C0E42AC|nr:glycosyltransferase [Polynucleobacter sp. 15G-AUS-farblos]MBU3584095.1 hypothetical protein [Polynucleobacter sp. 15G-AUS-farblos]
MKKILFVAMQNSPHAMRWINQLEGSDYEVELFPNSPYKPHESLKKIRIHQSNLIRACHYLRGCCQNIVDRISGNKLAQIKKFLRVPFVLLMMGIDFFLMAIDSLELSFFGFKYSYRSVYYGQKRLNKIITKIRPDLVHSLEFQNCSYVVLDAKSSFNGVFPKWAATNWGSDIYYYQKINTHVPILKKLLNSIDYYLCECKRDITLAENLGYSGPTFPAIPNVGGFDLRSISVKRSYTPTSERRVIAIKGYENFTGKAITALKAIQACEKELLGYEVVVYSCSHETTDFIKILQKTTCINIRSLDKCSPDKILELFGRARIYMGLGLSDGISISMIEAMALGAFPIQTNTSCCEEWFESGKGGFSVTLDDFPDIVSKLRVAIKDDLLVSGAADINWNIIQERADIEKNRKKVLTLYHEILD